MQTLYYTTYNFIRHTDNVVDLGEYRRKLARAHDQQLSWQAEPEEEYEPQPFQPRPRRSQQRQERRWALMDKLAAAGIVVMTITFTLHVLCM